MNSYLFIKSIHITTAVLSLAGFILRTYWRFVSPNMLQKKLVKILPHINDTLLLVSAVSLTLLLGQYPFTHNWLTIKILLLLIYIISGSIVLKPSYSTTKPLFALAIAMGSFAGIVFIAIRHNY